MFGGFTFVAKNGRVFFEKTTCNCGEEDFFSKSNCQIQTPSLSQRSQSLIKPLLKNSFSTIFQGPGPGEAAFHFSSFFCWVHYCSKLCQSSSWKPKREASLFQNSNCQIQTPSLSQRSQSLIKPLLKNSFSTIFQGPGLLEAQKRSKPFPKAIAKFKPQAFPKGATPLLNPY